MAKKSLGADKPVSAQVETNTSDDVKKILNSGTDIETKAFGRLRVREMPAEDLIIFLLDSLETVQLVLSDLGGQDGLQSFKTIIQNKEVSYKVKQFIAKSAGIESDPLDPRMSELGLGDLLLLVNACKNVYDWNQIQKGFTDLGLMDLLPTMFQSTKEQQTESQE
jgi:hypothetical protein